MIVIGFCGALGMGLLMIPRASANQVMFGWAIAIGVLLFSWTIGFITDLQRSELLPLEKMLHLPVTTRGVFLLNYLSSLFSLTLLACLPVMAGAVIAHVAVSGAEWLLLIPAILGLLVMITGVTYQLRGWLGMLVTNKRRQKRIVMGVTLAVILASQIPNMLSVAYAGRNRERRRETKRLREEQRQRLQSELDDGEITATEFQAGLSAMSRRNRAERKVETERIVTWVRRVCVIAPPVWPAYGIGALHQGHVFPILLATMGTTLIGSVSLWRSYRSTMRQHLGHNRAATTSRGKHEVNAPTRVPFNWLENSIPGVSDTTSAVAMASLRSMQRAPEAKLGMLTPLFIFMGIGASLSFSTQQISALPDVARPAMALLPLWICVFSVSQLSQNAFGFDRNGFRAFVLSPTSRRDILLGKNLALLPVVLAMGLLVLAGFQFLLPLRWDHLLATCVQLVSIFLITCVTANLASIFAPMAVSSQALQKSHPQLSKILLQMVFAVLAPAACAPLIAPYGVEVGLSWLGWTSTSMPVYFLLTFPVLALVCWLYGICLRLQGQLLQERELSILEVVTKKVD
jgi:hypothetical protein